MEKRLKSTVLKFIKTEGNKRGLNNLALRSSNKSLTYHQLINEIENETEIGEELVEDFIKLTIFRLLRGIDNIEEIKNRKI